MATANDKVPQVTPESTPADVSAAAAAALTHQLSDQLNKAERNILTQAANDPVNRNPAAHAIVVMMGKQERQAKIASVSVKAEPHDNSHVIADRQAADAILADSDLVWAIMARERGDIVRKLNMSKPQAVQEGLVAFKEEADFFWELRQLRSSMEEVALRVVDQQKTTRIVAKELDVLARNVDSLLDWLGDYRAQMTPAQARKADQIIADLDVCHQDPERLPLVIAEGDRLLGKLVTGRWSNK